MDVHRTTDRAAFVDAVMPFLAAEPVRNTVLLTVLDQLQYGSRGNEWFAWVCDRGEVVGAALRTPPYPVALAAMSEPAAAALGARDESPGAVGALDVVTAFAGQRQLTVNIREQQYVLTDLISPPPTSGAARPFDASTDADRYVQWLRDFADEAGVMHDGDALPALDRRLRSGGAMWFWERNGEPVAMAGRSGPVLGVPRVGPVWTPPEHRRNGYAAALTAHVCAQALAAGARACTLYADAANVTSNGVYRRLGFEPVAEIVDARFTPSTPDVS